jgi:hypothetical protein
MSYKGKRNGRERAKKGKRAAHRGCSGVRSARTCLARVAPHHAANAPKRQRKTPRRRGQGRRKAEERDDGDDAKQLKRRRHQV